MYKLTKPRQIWAQLDKGELLFSKWFYSNINKYRHEKLNITGPGVTNLEDQAGIILP